MESDSTKERYKEGWDESKWSEELETHPLFMTKQPDGDQQLEPLVDAFRQLKYDKDFNTSVELAVSYKEDGNVHFKEKNYRWAIQSYTKAIELRCDDNAINSMVHSNRSSAHYHLSNYRSSLNDALKAFELNCENTKALTRIVMCYYELKKYQQCFDLCEKYSDKQIETLRDYQKKAAIELKLTERNRRKQESDLRRERSIREEIVNAVNKRNIKYKSVKSLFESIHGAVNDRHVILNEKLNLVWPVLLVYPEYGQTDFIESFDENHTFRQHLEIMFDEFPVWDKSKKYSIDNIIIGYKSILNDEIIKVDCGQQLKQVLVSHDFMLTSSVPTFILTAERKKENKNVKTKVEVSLGDCLACSGCITSAETILIQQQSHEELYKIIESNKNNTSNRKVVVISLSLQSIASIAAKYDLNMKDCSEKLTCFFKNLGVDYVFDISLARHLSLIEAQNEFIERFNKNSFPVLTSVCPGWVCYAEKTHGELIVPLLSKVKSPQQIMGVLVKSLLLPQQRENIYHITIMPCYDKKLEATRNELNDSGDNISKEVDCVLTPLEIEIMLNKENVILSDLNNQLLDTIIPEFQNELLKSHLGSGSGGYVENLFRFMATKYFNSDKTGQQLNYKTVRNRDFIELTLEDESNNKLLSFAIVNGFRNIQTLVQRIKRKTCHYQYVEVMACPSGCLNGGAQLRADRPLEDNILDKVVNLYNSLDIISLPVDRESNTIKHLYTKCFATPNELNLYTTFKPVVKNLNLINVNW